MQREYGYGIINGRPVTSEEYASRMGVDPSKAGLVREITGQRLIGNSQPSGIASPRRGALPSQAVVQRVAPAARGRSSNVIGVRGTGLRQEYGVAGQGSRVTNFKTAAGLTPRQRLNLRSIAFL